jgi:hypothetical protein
LICSSSRTTVFLPSESRCTELKPSPDRLCTSPVHRVRTRPPIAHIDCQRAGNELPTSGAPKSTRTTLNRQGVNRLEFQLLRP